MSETTPNTPSNQSTAQKNAVLSVVKAVIATHSVKSLDTLLASGLDMDFSHPPLFQAFLEASNHLSFKPSRNSWFSAADATSALAMSNKLFLETEKRVGVLDPLKKTPLSSHKNLLHCLVESNHFITLYSFLKTGKVSPQDIKKLGHDLGGFLKEETWTNVKKVGETHGLSSPAAQEFLNDLEEYRAENLWVLTSSSKPFGSVKKNPFVESDIDRLLLHEKSRQGYGGNPPSRMSSLLLEKIQDEALIDKLSPTKVVEYLRKDKGQFWTFARTKMESLKASKDKNAVIVFLQKYADVMTIDDVRENTDMRGRSSSEPRWNGAALYVLYKRAHALLSTPMVTKDLDLYFTLKAALSKPHEKDLETSPDLWKARKELFGSKVDIDVAPSRAIMISSLASDIKTVDEFEEKLPDLLKAIQNVPQGQQVQPLLLQGLWVILSKEDDKSPIRPYVSQMIWHAIMTSDPSTQSTWVRRFMEVDKHIEKNPRLQMLYKFPRWDLTEPTFEDFRVSKGKAKNKPVSFNEMEKAVLLVATYQVAAPSAPRVQRKM